jgi:hypothetical protein
VLGTIIGRELGVEEIVVQQKRSEQSRNTTEELR